MPKPGFSLATVFPLLAASGVAVALFFPEPIVLLRPAMGPLLGVVMFGIGLSLAGRDFVAVVKRPGIIALGIVLQFAIMPLAAWMVGHAMRLPVESIIGLILVGACPGGTVSNVICYLARADVALSIALTTISTFLAVVLTPILTWLYVGQMVSVPMAPMLVSVAQVIILPVAAGVAANHYLGPRLHGLRNAFRPISVAAMVTIMAFMVARNADADADLIWPLIFAVALHNALGLAAGYGIPLMLGVDRRACRTLAIEVGMQNTGLGVALATQFISAAASLPGAVFGVWHNLSGATLAASWARRPVPEEEGSDENHATRF